VTASPTYFDMISTALTSVDLIFAMILPPVHSPQERSHETEKSVYEFADLMPSLKVERS